MQRETDLKRIRDMFKAVSYRQQRKIWERAGGNVDKLRDLICDAVDDICPQEAVDTPPCAICDEQLIAENSVNFDCGHSFHFSCASRYLAEKMQLDMTYLLDCPTCKADRTTEPQCGKLYLHETDRIKRIVKDMCREALENGEEEDTINSWDMVWSPMDSIL